jgi:hypothetical protein
MLVRQGIRDMDDADGVERIMGTLVGWVFLLHAPHDIDGLRKAFPRAGFDETLHAQIVARANALEGRLCSYIMRGTTRQKLQRNLGFLEANIAFGRFEACPTKNNYGARAPLARVGGIPRVSSREKARF